MFRVLMAKMVEREISYEALSEAVGMSVKVLKQCINGERELRLSECVKIRAFVAPDMTIDELFKPKTEMQQ